MKNHFSDVFTQGGQTQLHKFHMMKQVIGTTIKIGLWTWLIAFVGLILMTYVWQDFWLAICYGKAYARKVHFKMLPKDFWDSCWLISRKTGEWLEYRDFAIIKDVQITRFVHMFLTGLLTKLIQALGIAILGVSTMIWYWYRKGHCKIQAKILKGAEEVSNKKLIRLLKRRKMNSDMHLARVPLVRDRETEHMMVVGTTGTGKSNALMDIMDQIRLRGEKAIIVDSTNELFRRYYLPSDILMNPLDGRSSPWDLWKECEEDYHLHEFAECLIPETGSDTFWVRSARSLFVETAKIIQDQPNYQKLQVIATQMPIKEASVLFKATKVESLMNVESEKTALSVRNTLMNELHAFDYLKYQDNGFTIQSWLESARDSWLFLSCNTNQRTLLRPLYSGWFAIAARKMMEVSSSKVWFIIDELPSLNRLPELPRALAEVRKYGGCFVMGMQNINQLDDLYGRAMARTITSLAGTKVIFRCGDHSSAQELSHILGDQEIQEHQESISFGAHQMRDGVNLTHHTHIKPAITPTDVMNLPNLEAYLKLPGDLPITKLKFRYTQRPFITQGFVKKIGTNELES